jgi:DNA repair exonuclease SbcCD ATPase subunit
MKNKIQYLMPDVNKNKNFISKYEIELEKQTNLLKDVENDNYIKDLSKLKIKLDSNIKFKTAEIEQVEENINNIKNGIYSQSLKDELQKLTDYDIRLKEELVKNKEEIIIRKKNKQEKVLEISDIEKDIQIIQVQKEEVKTYNFMLSQNNEYLLKNTNTELYIEKANNSIKRYNDNILFIQQNELINEKISEYDNNISEINIEKEDLNKIISDILNETNVAKNTAKDIKNNIVIYNAQVKREEILKVYQKCVHRDGIPLFLLMKSKDLINQELSDILSSVDFNIFFDSNMNLKMYMESSSDIIQNVLEGSGAERTFSAIALKLSLRAINNNSRPNFLLLDEITGKLKNKAVINFNLMLEKMKERVDKIIIIEQNHPINFDSMIDITKDVNGISSLTINNNYGL